MKRQTIDRDQIAFESQDVETLTPCGGGLAGPAAGRRRCTMTTDDLARAVTIAPGFKWLSGMAVAVPPKHAAEEDLWVRIGPMGAVDVRDVRRIDLADPATAGCLLAMVVERWPLSFGRARSGTWTVYLHLIGGDYDHPADQRWFEGQTLGEACARALVEGPR